jgi:hypothetical protein
MEHGEVMMMEYVFSDAVKETLGSRGLKEDDIKAVIDYAESSNDKITDGEKFLAKKEIGDLTVYAVYKIDGGKAIVESGYSHKMKILDIVQDTEDAEGWTYVKNGAKLRRGHTNLTYMGATRSGPSLCEPTSGESWFEEYLAAGPLTAAEGLFEQKRA